LKREELQRNTAIKRLEIQRNEQLKEQTSDAKNQE
jgi:hypothetical protein